MTRISRTPDLRRWLSFVVHHPWPVLILVLVPTLLFAWRLPELRFQTSIYDLTIEEMPETADYQAFKERFGSEEIILVVAKVEYGNLFEPRVFERIGELARALGNIEGVRRVLSLPGIRQAMDRTGAWSLADFERIIGPVSLVDRNLLSRNRRATAITLVLGDGAEKDRIVDSVGRVIGGDWPPLSLYQIGMPNVSRALAQFTERDFLRLPFLTFGLIALLLFLLFRKLRGVLLPAGAVLLALLWTFGLMAWSGTALSMLTMIVPVFLIAVGTAYCMYVFSEYCAAAQEGSTPPEVTLACFLELGFPTTLAVLTTTIGLGSLLLNRIPAIREFALFCSFGILALLFLLLTFMPALMALLPLPERTRGPESAWDDWLRPLLSRIVRLNLLHQRATFVAVGLVTLAGLLGIARIQVETNPVEFFKPETEVARHFRDIHQELAGCFPLNVVIDGGQEDFLEHPANLNHIEQFQRYLETIAGVDKSISIVDYLKLVNYAGNRFDEAHHRLPEQAFEIRMLFNSLKTLLGSDLLATFASPDLAQANILLRTHLSSSNDFLATQQKVEAYPVPDTPPAFTARVTGFGVVISRSGHLLTEGQIKSLFLTLVLVFLIMFALFLSPKVGLIGMVPNLFPIIVSFGLMGWAGIPLSMATSLVAGIAIGLAVDDTIHYLVRYNKEFKRDLDKRRAMRDTVLRMGKPILGTTLTISLGFSVLMISSFKPTAVFGLLMVAVMLSALVADLVLLPTLMLRVELVTLWDLLRLKLGRDPQEGIPLFEGLSRTQVHYVLMAGTLRSQRRGEVLFRKGDRSDSMYAVISGELQVVDLPTGSAAGSEASQHINTVGSGGVVGEMGMIRACARSATVMVSAPTELLEINERMIKRLQWLYPPTAHRFFFNLLRQLCDRLDALTACYLDANVRDTASGLFNQGFLREMLAREEQIARRHPMPLSLLCLQLAHLDRLQGQFGAAVADFVAGETGQALRELCRQTDLPCRCDARTFAVILPFTPAEQAELLCRRIREALEKRTFRFEGTPIHPHFRAAAVGFDPASPPESADLIGQALNLLEAQDR